uniref:TIL domain-containing protein n=1 Tax=Xenopus tropicalis TaxID=8364 RepID=A0A803J7T0_XENTR
MGLIDLETALIRKAGVPFSSRSPWSISTFSRRLGETVSSSRKSFMMATWQKYSSLGLLAMALLFVAVDQSQAVPPKPECRVNMVYGCMRTCYSNCDNMNSTIDACTKMCLMGCDCKDGFVFKSKDSKRCVPVSECKVTCPKHMTYNPCTKETRKTCATMNKPPVPLKPCKPRCVCDKGFILSNDHVPRCIRISECPKKPAN